MALQVAEAVFAELAGAETVVTSGLDGQHKPGSQHYRGLAVDLRIKHVPTDKREAIRDALQARLGPGFLVLHETAQTPGATGEHIHIEWKG